MTAAATLGELRGGEVAPRLCELARIFEQVVTDASFPCIYTRIPFAQEDVSFSYHRRSDDRLVESVVGDLRRLVAAAKESIDAMAVVFVDDDDDRELHLDDDRDLARSVVAGVLAVASADAGAGGCPVSSTDPGWMLELDGLGLFVNISSPRHRLRRSRDVGPAFTIIAQARASFDQGGRALPSVRELIRRRVADYDDVAPHPALGTFGDPGNREALQYFLGDGAEEHDITVATPVAADRSGHGHPI